MTDKKRLIELISEFCEHVPHAEGQTWEEACADFLLDNGVTVQGIEDRVTEYGFGYAQGYSDCEAQYRWIPVTERLPGAGERVLTYDRRGHTHDRSIREVAGRPFFSPDGLAPGRDVTHWMPLPQPPKEVRYDD